MGLFKIKCKLHHTKKHLSHAFWGISYYFPYRFEVSEFVSRGYDTLSYHKFPVRIFDFSEIAIGNSVTVTHIQKNDFISSEWNLKIMAVSYQRLESNCKINRIP